MIPETTQPMLAKLEAETPEGDGWLYEPKWDGFRCLVFVRDDVSIMSRDQRPLGHYFPELVEKLRGRPRGILDGEIVVPQDGIPEFGVLQQRLHPAESRARKLARETPASFVAFDLLEDDGTELLGEPFAARRRRLETRIRRIAEPCTIPSQTSVLLTMQTDDPKVAGVWFSEMEQCGIDGIVAKRKDLLYQPGKRSMVKVKHRRTAECVVGGYRKGKQGGVGSLLLGLYDRSGGLHYIGHCSAFTAAERRRLLEELSPLEGADSFGEARTPGGPSRWSAGKDISWVSVKPVRVCEVEYDRLQGDRFRHAAKLLRWRPERDPHSCTMDQVRPR